MRFISLMTPVTTKPEAAAIEPLALALLGGKAAKLNLMQQQGLPVPPWFVVNARAWARFAQEQNIVALLKEAEATASYSSRIEAAILNTPLPQDLATELNQVFAPAAGNPALPWFSADTAVAVRSSGLEEDSVQHSFAGQFSSFLFQKGRAAIELAIKRCWASAFSERCLSYRQQHGLPLVGTGVAVIVQKMVDAEVSGVAFSRHPLRILERQGMHGPGLVSAVYGAGEALVSGQVDADAYVIDSKTLGITKTLADKAEALRLNAAGILQMMAVDDDLRLAPALSDAEILRIFSLSMQLEKLTATPQDVEWVLEASANSLQRTLYLVQTRPITTVPGDAFFASDINGDEVNLWDNSNIVESYSGVTTPLTFSFASRAYQEVYIQFCKVMGVPEKSIVAHGDSFRNLLGLLRGRIYYNLPHWYALVLMLPGSQGNKAFMETMMGVKQGLRPELAKLFAFAENPPHYSIGQKLILLGKTLGRFIFIDRIVEGFFASFNRHYQEARSKAYASMSLPMLAQEYSALESKMLRSWQAPIINDYLCMIFFGILKKLCEKWLKGTSPSLQNDLLCGEGGLESTEPTKYLMRIAAMIDQDDPDFRLEFCRLSATELTQRYIQGQLPAKVQRLIADYLERYGFRCVNELKLEEPDLHDDPGFVLASVQSYIKTKAYDAEKLASREQEIRQSAEAKVTERLSPLRLKIFSFVLKNTRRAVKNRENLRFARTKIFGISRHLFRAMGDKFCQLGLLDEGRDIFYLSVDEILQSIEGRALTRDLKALATIRKREFAEYRKGPALPERFLTKGVVAASLGLPSLLIEADLLKKDTAAADADPDNLYGTPCSPGLIEGRVRVAEQLADAIGLDGDILVTARTDPGWVPLFPACAGLLIERGSLLSHSAVVARELGLPTIVGVSGGLMTKLKTGDRVRVDATTGHITILERAP